MARFVVDEELADSERHRKFAGVALGRDNGERQDHHPAPRADLVEMKVERLGKEDDLGRNRGHRVPRDLPEPGEIKLGERVAPLRAAEMTHDRARLLHVRRLRRIAEQLETEVSLDRRGQVGW